MSEHELYHHGVKGMTWGVRKDRNKRPSGNKTQGVGSIRSKAKVAVNSARNYAKELKDAYRSRVEEAKRELEQKSSSGKMWILNNDALMNMAIRESNRIAMEQANRAAINASLQAASLSMSGGTNPFMFGMM